MAEARHNRVAEEPSRENPQIELGLNAAIVMVREQQPYILVARSGADGGKMDALPFGPFAPRAHRTLEIGLREWVKRQTGLDLGYVEQLYTFGDRGRHEEPGGAHMLSVGYLALTRGGAEDLHRPPEQRVAFAQSAKEIDPPFNGIHLLPAHCESYQQVC